ncbi:hypothetical protein BCR33DRAFT_713812 [Rhizoclosmatium globosum]|uniref:Uncharacterized protein n=1 Tax=Rhizoclosmatium globosum TaxID=329046 RepID=A0A1Y2CR50_9FUNG|nr:hypothetical protein BCR33DRAFT_713812 [Rhizoclosmatium globosum]|eukprot:ORY49511.1 hypothetical protein BCR33DRAFT_713812 [Rhizoclosmatium globosum]
MGSRFSKFNKRVDPKPDYATSATSVTGSSSSPQRGLEHIASPVISISAVNFLDPNENSSAVASPPIPSQITTTENSLNVETRSMISINPSIASWSNYKKKPLFPSNRVATSQLSDTASNINQPRSMKVHVTSDCGDQDSYYAATGTRTNNNGGEKTIRSTQADFRWQFAEEDEESCCLSEDEGSLKYDDVLVSPIATKHSNEADYSGNAARGVILFDEESRSVVEDGGSVYGDVAVAVEGNR